MSLANAGIGSAVLVPLLLLPFPIGDLDHSETKACATPLASKMSDASVKNAHNVSVTGQTTVK